MNSRFATLEEIKSADFQAINLEMTKLHRKYKLPDHFKVNRLRYPWSDGMQFIRPEVYAARLWEYPYGVLEADLSKGMAVADIGCGMSAFTLYLRDVAGCKVVGVDPLLFKAKHLGTGVSREYVETSGLPFVKKIQAIDSETVDRVFCISVIEHVARRKFPELMREMSRILKPGGILVTTMDVNLTFDMARPLDVVWQTGLLPKGDLCLGWPQQRFGRADNPWHAADVYGLVLKKPETQINAVFDGADMPIYQSDIPWCRYQEAKHTAWPIRIRRYIKEHYTGR